MGRLRVGRLLVWVMPTVCVWLAGYAPDVAHHNARQRTSSSPMKYCNRQLAGTPPFSLAVDREGHLWFTSPGPHGVIVRFTPCGPTRIFSLPRIANPTGSIVLGPDGNLWFPAAYAIVRMTPQGHLTAFTISRPDNLQIQAIIVGPDGNLWFTENYRDSIGVMDMHGRLVHTYVLARLTQPGDVPTLGPSGITIGPDHAMWLTEELANKIGRLTLSGHLKGFAGPTCACGEDHSSGVQDIVAGPDGGLWFTEVNANRIGRIGLDGRIREFPIPSSGSNNTRDPVSLLVGPDGNLWFAEFFAGKIARVTMDGRVTEFSLPGSGDVPNGTPTIGTVSSLARGKNRRLLFVATNGFGTISMDGHLVTYFYSHKVVYSG